MILSDPSILTPLRKLIKTKVLVNLIFRLNETYI